MLFYRPPNYLGLRSVSEATDIFAMLYARNGVLIKLFLRLDRGQISRRLRNLNIRRGNRMSQLLGEGFSNSHLCMTSKGKLTSLSG